MPKTSPSQSIPWNDSAAPVALHVRSTPPPSLHGRHNRPCQPVLLSHPPQLSPRIWTVGMFGIVWQHMAAWNQLASESIATLCNLPPRTTRDYKSAFILARGVECVRPLACWCECTEIQQPDCWTCCNDSHLTLLLAHSVISFRRSSSMTSHKGILSNGDMQHKAARAAVKPTVSEAWASWRSMKISVSLTTRLLRVQKSGFCAFVMTCIAGVHELDFIEFHRKFRSLSGTPILIHVFGPMTSPSAEALHRTGSAKSSLAWTKCGKGKERKRYACSRSANWSTVLYIDSRSQQAMHHPIQFSHGQKSRKCHEKH